MTRGLGFGRLGTRLTGRRVPSVPTVVAVVVSFVGASVLLTAGPVAASGWTPTKAPLPTGAGASPKAFLASVACPSTTTCIAVGSYQDTTPSTQGLIDTLSGGTWTAIAAPLGPGPATNPSAFLASVACPSTTACIAVGSYGDSSSHAQGLIDTLSGATWTAIAAPLGAGPATDPVAGVISVACPSTTTCIAVGGYNDSPTNSEGLIDTLSGGTWSGLKAPLGPSPATNPVASLASVACPSTTACTAVGAYNDSSSNSQGLIDTLSGSTWSGIVAPLPVGAATNPFSSLVSVVCPSAGTCTSVSNYNDTPTNTQGLIESISPPPPPCGFSITMPSALPSATHGVPYFTTLTGCGGTPPYRFKKIGKLPKGLKLNHSGAIYGTPTKAGAYSFGVRMTDKAKPKHSTTSSFSITVR
jgi:hypothetical protein